MYFLRGIWGGESDSGITDSLISCVYVAVCGCINEDITSLDLAAEKTHVKMTSKPHMFIYSLLMSKIISSEAGLRKHTHTQTDAH